MGIGAIENGGPWWGKVEAAVDYWFGPGASAGFETNGDALARLNTMADALAVPRLSNLESRLSCRGKINAIIAALGIPAEAAFYFDFREGRSFGALPQLVRHTKTWARDATGEIHEFEIDQLARFNGLGAVLAPARTRLSLAPGRVGASPWNSSGSIAFTELDPEGFFIPCRIESGGAATDRRQSGLFSMTVNAPVSVLARYRAGTSPTTRIYVRSGALAMQSLLSGNVGALAQTQSQAGFFSNIQNRHLGDGLYEVAATFTPVATQSDWRLSIGPGSTVAGEYVDALGAQVTSGPAEWVFGEPSAQVAVAADQIFVEGLAGNHALHILLADDMEIAVLGWNAADPVPLAGIDGRPVRSITGVAS